MHNYKYIYKANFLPLLDGLKQDIKHWDLLPLSMSGRNTIKMNVWPKFLYPLQNFPIFQTKFFFSSIDKLISTFIWNKKKPTYAQTMSSGWHGTSQILILLLHSQY